MVCLLRKGFFSERSKFFSSRVASPSEKGCKNVYPYTLMKVLMIVLGGALWKQERYNEIPQNTCIF